MPRPSVTDVLTAAGFNSGENPPSAEHQRQAAEAIILAKQDPTQLAVKYMSQQILLERANRNCSQAAEACEQLDAMLAKLLNGNRVLCRLESVRETPTGPRAVCSVNGHLRELPIHPEVDIEQLKQIEWWEYVAVNEQVVVGTWANDPYLFNSALGDVVAFKGYKDREQHLVRVTHGPEEKVVSLARSLWETELVPSCKLVLQRDNPHRAISVVPADHTQSRFEVPIDKIHTRLEDLAGVEEIAQELLEDILLRIFHTGTRDQFRLDPLKGILLYSKPGMGKTAFARALSLWLAENSEPLGFDVVLYLVRPNETKSMWHGEDARIVREELWGAIRARQTLPRERALVQIVVLDEIDSLGKRGGAGEQVHSAAQTDGLEAMLAEMDGMIQQDQRAGGPPAHVLCVGMTNRLDRVDEAAKRAGRFDLVVPMPPVDQDSAEDVMAIYARGESLPWCFGEEVETSVEESEIRQHVLQPALAQVFPATVLRYKTDTQRANDVSAGEILANVHYKDAMNRAKKRAALRQLREVGLPAVTFDDVADCLVDVAFEFARQMESDPQMLIRQLGIRVPVAGVETVPKEELQQHRYLRVRSA